MVTVVSGRALGVLSLVLLASCGGQSRSESERGEERGGGAGESNGGSFTGGAGANGGTAGDTGVAGTGGGSRPPLPCTEGEPVFLEPEITANHLSRLFFGTIASEELMDRARAVGLATSGAVGCFARAMLDDEQSKVGLSDFFGGWLDLGKRPEPLQDPTLVPAFSPELLLRAKEASVWFAVEAARTDGTLAQLLEDPLVPVDATLAPHYGISAMLGSDFAMFDQGDERAGILTQLYFLMSRTTRAHGSPTQRGAGLSQMLGCTEISPPPEDLALDVPTTFEGTTRSWYENSVSNEVCAGCHAFLTQTGFAFEHFDVLGHYRN